MKMLFVLFSLFTVVAHADQCQWTSSTDATSAMQLIKLHKEVMHFCQACGDGKPSFISSIDDVGTAQASMAGKKYPYRTLKLTSGKETTEVDLAYLYVRTASDIFTNVAQLVGCPSTGVTTFIQTTNRNQKISHFYDASGARVDVATTTAAVEKMFPGDRTPASKK